MSRNPHLSLIHLRPNPEDVLIDVGEGVQHADVVLNYCFGWSIRPVSDWRAGSVGLPAAG